MEKHKVICPYCGAGCQFNLLVQNGQVVGTEAAQRHHQPERAVP